MKDMCVSVYIRSRMSARMRALKGLDDVAMKRSTGGRQQKIMEGEGRGTSEH